MLGLIGTAFTFFIAISSFVSPAAQPTAYALVAMGLGLGTALWARDGRVW